MKPVLKAVLHIIGAASACLPGLSQAYLGGFEDGDGYQFAGLPGMVNGYNAGEYGTGGAYTPFGGVPPYDQGIWNDLNNAYSTYNFIGNTGGYYVAKHPEVSFLGMFPHDGQAALALRNTGYGAGSFGPPRPLDFSYKLDTRDFYNGGKPVNPADTGNKVVNWSIWVGPGPQRRSMTASGSASSTAPVLLASSSAGTSRTSCATETRLRHRGSRRVTFLGDPGIFLAR